LADVERDSCPGCGYHESITDDRSNVFSPDNDYCPVCAGRDRWDRMLDAQDRQWAERHKDARSSQPHPTDGRLPTRMKHLSPEEAEQRRGGGSGNQD